MKQEITTTVPSNFGVKGEIVGLETDAAGSETKDGF